MVRPLKITVNYDTQILLLSTFDIIEFISKFVFFQISILPQLESMYLVLFRCNLSLLSKKAIGREGPTHFFTKINFCYYFKYKLQANFYKAQKYQLTSEFFFFFVNKLSIQAYGPQIFRSQFSQKF